MTSLFKRFTAARKSAIAVIFSICLVPLVLLVALTVDYAFYVQARAQAALAADAAATHAVRAADEAYTYELAQNDPNAAADAAAAGSAIGKSWFAATLGTMPKTTIPDPIVAVQQNASGAAGFTATVNFGGTYPPFFATLFNNLPWHVDGKAGASSAYDYVEILMLLDNSPSMLIGADNTNIETLETNSACPPAATASNFGGNGWASALDQNVAPDAAGDSPAPIPTAFSNAQPGNPAVNPDGTVNQPKCNSGFIGPYAPCAFACHTTTQTMTVNNKTEYADYFGIARAYGATLRLDVLQQAAGQVITDMEANEQAADQFSIGVYQFNDDVVPVYPAPGTPASPQAEASTNLSAAATAITNAAPPLESDAGIGYTDFPTSVADLISGKYSNGTEYRAALTAGGTGNAAASPQKDIFIVTDGMEDTKDSGTRLEGEMTSYTAETAASPLAVTPAICKALKTTYNATVYVLYIDYEPLSNDYYQTTDVTSTKYLNQDFPGLANQTPKDFAENTGAGAPAGAPANPYATLTPDEAGLEACASSTSDFFEATSPKDIGTALNAMLQSALTSTIQITQ